MLDPEYASGLPHKFKVETSVWATRYLDAQFSRFELANSRTNDRSQLGAPSSLRDEITAHGRRQRRQQARVLTWVRTPFKNSHPSISQARPGCRSKTKGLKSQHTRHEHGSLSREQTTWALGLQPSPFKMSSLERAKEDGCGIWADERAAAIFAAFACKRWSWC